MFLKSLKFIALILIVSLIPACGPNDKHVCFLVPTNLQENNMSDSNFNKELIPAGNGSSAIHVRDNYAYLGFGTTFFVLDISDASNPLQISSISLPNEVDSIVVTDNYAFVSPNEVENLYGLSSVIDISNPESLVELNCQDELIPSFYRAVQSQEFIFVPLPSLVEGVLHVYDINANAISTEIVETETYESRTPMEIRLSPNPEIIGSEPKVLTDVLIMENYAFLAENQFNGEYLESGQIQVLDVSNPRSIKPVATYIMPQEGSAIKLYSNEKYIVVSGSSGMDNSGLTLDISEPSAPSLVTMFKDSGFPIGLNNNFLYSMVTYMDGTTTVRVRDMTNPDQIKQIDWDPSVIGWAFQWQGEVVFIENYAYFLIGGLLRIIDITDPFNPIEVNIVDIDS